jgi:glycosyltransferase involved in cell wall biosynthesis
MRVCFVINEFSFFMSHRFDLLAELSKKNHVTVITDTTFASEIDIDRCLKHNIQLQHLKQRSKNKKFSYFRFFYQLRKKIYQSYYEHVFFVTIEMSLFGSLLKNKKYIKNKYYLVTGLGAFFFKRKIKYKIVKAIYSFGFGQELKNNFSKFIFQNHSNKDLFISLNYASEKNSIVIRGNGIPKANLVEKRNLDHKKLIRFCFAGNLTISKGLQELLQASENLFRKNQNFELNIAGKYLSSEDDYISQACFEKMQQSSYVNFYGRLDHSEMNDFYSNSDIFILPSYGEGIPKSALEAASNGLPLILTDVDGCNECIDNNGFLVPVGDIVGLENEMFRFISNPGMIDEMSKKSLALIEKKFDVGLIAGQYLQLIDTKI